MWRRIQEGILDQQSLTASTSQDLASSLSLSLVSDLKYDIASDRSDVHVLWSVILLLHIHHRPGQLRHVIAKKAVR